MMLRIIVGEIVLRAVLFECETTKDFISKLPVTLDMQDYDGKEKVSDQLGALSTDGAPSGCQYKTGDLIYFSPWRNLCIVYNLDQYYNGVIKIGRLVDGIEHFQISGTVRTRFEIDPNDNSTDFESTCFTECGKARLGSGEIAGIVIGCIAFVVIVIVVSIVIIRKRKSNVSNE